MGDTSKLQTDKRADTSVSLAARSDSAVQGVDTAHRTAHGGRFMILPGSVRSASAQSLPLPSLANGKKPLSLPITASASKAEEKPLSLPVAVSAAKDETQPAPIPVTVSAAKDETQPAPIPVTISAAKAEENPAPIPIAVSAAKAEENPAPIPIAVSAAKDETQPAPIPVAVSAAKAKEKPAPVPVAISASKAEENPAPIPIAVSAAKDEEKPAPIPVAISASKAEEKPAPIPVAISAAKAEEKPAPVPVAIPAPGESTSQEKADSAEEQTKEKIPFGYIAVPDKAKPKFDDYNSGPHADDIVWQYYSPVQWEKMRSGFSSGSVWARANMERIYQFFMADSAYQTEVCGEDYEWERHHIEVLRRIGWALNAINILLGIFILKDLTPFFIFIGLPLYMWFYKRARYDSKGKGVFVVGVVVFLALWYHIRIHQLLVFLLAFTIIDLLWPFYLFGVVRQRCLMRLKSNYNFFKHVTGRPSDYPDRPMITLIKTDRFSLVGLPWDINPVPALSDLQINSPYPTIVGRSYDYYFDHFDTRLLAFVSSFLIAVLCDKPLWPRVLVVSLVMSIMYVFVSPSQRFIEFRASRNESSRGNLGDDSSTYYMFFAANFLWTTFCLMVMTTIMEYAVPFFGHHLATQLDELCTGWRTYIPHFNL